jgi:lipopolysaccharide export LptBFGC system permease protein LptF
MKFFAYILRQLLAGFLFSAAGMVFIAMPGIAVKAVHMLGGAGTLSVLKFVPMMVAVFVPYVLPVALLLAIVSTYGRLAAQNEWTAMRMAGVNPYQMLLPAALLAACAGTGVYALNAELLPRIKAWEKTAQLQVLKSALKNLSPGRTEVQIQDFYLSSAKRHPDDPEVFYDCFIDFPSEGEGREPESFFADAVRFHFDQGTMTASLYGATGTTAEIEAASENFEVTVNLEEISGSTNRHDFRNSRYQTSGQLRELGVQLELERVYLTNWMAAQNFEPPEAFHEHWRRQDRRLRYTWHQRIANGATCLMFVLVGVSTGVFLRKGTQLSALAVAVAYAMVYWIASLRLGKQLAYSGALEPWLGAWAPLVLFTLVGAWMTRRAFAE